MRFLLYSLRPSSYSFFPLFICFLSEDISPLILLMACWAISISLFMVSQATRSRDSFVMSL